MHLIEGVATEVYNAYFPHSIALSDAVNLAAKGQTIVFFPVVRLWVLSQGEIVITRVLFFIRKLSIL